MALIFRIFVSLYQGRGEGSLGMGGNPGRSLRSPAFPLKSWGGRGATGLARVLLQSYGESLALEHTVHPREGGDPGLSDNQTG